MRSVVVVESMFGNTRSVAEAVAEGLVDAEVIDVREAPSEFPADDVGLVVVGGPTHAFGMSRPGTRADAGRQGAADPGVGIRDLLNRLRANEDLRVATFDTRVEKVRHLPGSAARSAARSLRRSGFVLVSRPESFYVVDTPGPLVEGELERARLWGERLARTTS